MHSTKELVLKFQKMEQAEIDRMPLRPQPKAGPLKNQMKKKNHTVCISRQMYDRPVS